MPVALIPAALAAFQIGKGIVDSSNAKKDEKAALAKIKPYKTPQAVLDVLQATQYNAQSGFDASTLNYLTNQVDNSFGGSLATAQKLGADPNALSAIFGQKINGIMQIGAENHQLQMQNFSAYINALNATAANDAAEQKSAQDLLKDQLQKIAQEKALATQQINAGLNTAASTLSNYGIAKLYANANTPDATIPNQTTNTTGYNPLSLTSQQYRTTGLQIPQ